MVPVTQAAAQLVQVAAFVVVLYVEPAMQAVHPVFAVVVQALLRLVPAAHTVQGVHAAALVIVLKVDPAMHDEQALFTVVEQAVDA